MSENETELNPWLHMWRSPAVFFHQVKDGYEVETISMVAAVYAFAATLAIIPRLYMELQHHQIGHIGSSLSLLLFGGVSYLVLIVLYLLLVSVKSYFVKISGRMMGGSANYKTLLRTVVICTIPFSQVTMLLSFFGITLAYGTQLLSSTMIFVGAMVYAFAKIANGVYLIVLRARAIAIVQGYRSAWKGFGNDLLGGLLAVLSILGLSAIVTLVVTLLF